MYTARLKLKIYYRLVNQWNLTMDIRHLWLLQQNSTNIYNLKAGLVDILY